MILRINVEILTTMLIWFTLLRMGLFLKLIGLGRFGKIFCFTRIVVLSDVIGVILEKLKFKWNHFGCKKRKTNVSLLHRSIYSYLHVHIMCIRVCIRLQCTQIFNFCHKLAIKLICRIQPKLYLSTGSESKEDLLFEKLWTIKSRLQVGTYGEKCREKSVPHFPNTPLLAKTHILMTKTI